MYYQLENQKQFIAEKQILTYKMYKIVLVTYILLLRLQPK